MCNSAPPPPCFAQAVSKCPPPPPPTSQHGTVTEAALQRAHPPNLGLRPWLIGTSRAKCVPPHHLWSLWSMSAALHDAVAHFQADPAGCLHLCWGFWDVLCNSPDRLASQAASPSCRGEIVDQRMNPPPPAFFMFLVDVPCFHSASVLVCKDLCWFVTFLSWIVKSCTVSVMDCKDLYRFCHGL